MKLHYFSLILLFIKEIINEDNSECPREFPLLDKTTNECVLDIFNENNYIISNQIIKSQWLNNIINLGEKNTWFTGMDFSSKGDLIVHAINLVRNGDLPIERYFYGIKSNGRALFYNNENNQFINNIIIYSNTSYLKYEFQFKRIKLINDEGKDYYLSPGFSDYGIEIIDFYNKKIVDIPQGQVFGYSDWSSIIYSILELYNEKNTYLITFIGNIDSSSFISFQKFKFYYPDISKENSYEKVFSTSPKDELKVYGSSIFSCIEIQKFNIIQCFYINYTRYYTIGLFKGNNLDLIYSKIIEDLPDESIESQIQRIFLQVIHLKNEISILGYTLINYPDYVYIQTKEIICNKYLKYEIDNYLLNFKKIIINIEKKINFFLHFTLFNLKKINNNKFSLISSSYDGYGLNIIIFDIYNFHDTNLFIKYYCIPMKIYDSQINRFLISVNFNGFLGLTYSAHKRKAQKFSFFIILNYINSIDSELINLEENTKLKLSDYINNMLIENNIVGVDLYGIKIIKLPNSKEIGVYYFSREKNSCIYENDILPPEDEILFIYDYESLKISDKIYTIEIAGVVKEPLYSESIKYTIHTEFYGKASPESYHISRILIGKSSFYNFTISNNIIGSNDGSCKLNCKICYNNICIKCFDNYLLIEDTNICQLNIPNKGYYYDSKSFLYKKCHESCKTCSNGPIYFYDRLEIEDTNCDECIENYYKLENTNNCVNKNNHPIAYYLDINKGLFFKCYEKCMTCSSKKKNSTYFNCIQCVENSILYPKSSNCLNCALRDKYVNYYQYDCIDYIPNGYYLFNNENKEIDLCYITCKHCEIKGDSYNHKCTECSEAYPYSYKNGTKCLDDCSKENLFADLKTKKCYDDCKDNDNERICNYKNICLSKNDHPKNYYLDGNDNFISICNTQTEYEFNNECYESCPDNTKIDNSITNKNICKCNNLYYLIEEDEICVNSNICPNEYPYLKLGTSECSNCPVKYKDECYLVCPPNTCITQINENLAVCVDKLEETKILGGICFDDFIRILDNVEQVNSSINMVVNNFQGVTVNIYENGIDIDEVKYIYPNLTFLHLEECGNELRRFYNLSLDDKLYIISVDILSKISYKIINDFNFEVYLKNGTKLKYLNICNNSSISISSSIVKKDLAHINEAEIFNNQGYDIYDLESEFYIDKCSAANINGNDIVIKDRIKDIYPYNISFCSNDCILTNIDLESKRVNCSCKISDNNKSIELNNSESEININDNDNFFIYLLDKINYKIFKCGKIFKKVKIKDYLNNSGFFLGIFYTIFNIICFILFTFVFTKKIRNQILKLAPQNQKNNNKKINKKLSKKELKFNYKLNNNNKKEKQKTKYKLNSNNKQTINYLINTKRKKGKLNKEKEKKQKSKIDYYPRKVFKTKETIKYNYDLSINGKNIDNYNILPYTRALKVDKRNIFIIFISLLKMKIEIISLLFYPEEFTHKSLTLSIYSFDFLLSYFMNALLYTDDVISQKYHNNGKLDLITSIVLSLISNIVSYIIISLIKLLATYNEYLTVLIKELKEKGIFISTFKRLYKLIKIKVAIFFIINFILSMSCIYYLLIFCEIYKKSQISLLINYLIGLLQSLILSFGISIITSILRFIGLKCRKKNIYRTSVYICDKF